MTMTNEPGYYEDGNFGIRIENQMIVKKAKTQFNFDNIDFFGFETTTFVPLDNNLIQKSLLTPSEIEWVNQYHVDCREKISPLIKDQKAIDWLAQRTVNLQ